MWWALPFTERDEMLMRGLGYDDAWIAWMKIAHDQNARTLITHETDTRVVEMGKRLTVTTCTTIFFGMHSVTSSLMAARRGTITVNSKSGIIILPAT